MHTASVMLLLTEQPDLYLRMRSCTNQSLSTLLLPRPTPQWWLWWRWRGGWWPAQLMWWCWRLCWLHYSLLPRCCHPQLRAGEEEGQEVVWIWIKWYGIIAQCMQQNAQDWGIHPSIMHCAITAILHRQYWLSLREAHSWTCVSA